MYVKSDTASVQKSGLLVVTEPLTDRVFSKALDVSGIKRDTFTIIPTTDQYCQYLDKAVADTRPSLILALGDTPLRELSLVSGGISDLRGYVLPSRYNIPMIPTYPSHLVRGAFHLFGAFLHDIRRAHSYAFKGVPNKLETSYDLKPSRAVVNDYLDRLRADRTLASAYDIETAHILGEAEPKDWRLKKIIQIQFSSAAGTALVLPWEEAWLEAIQTILATENMKWGWNDRLSDRLALKGQGMIINGEQHDLMNAWGHLQPNFVSSKDAGNDEDKGIPARLMSLQACVSFYFPYEEPWKGVVQRAIAEGADPQQVLRWYGARDADLTFRVGVRIFKALKDGGLW